MQFSQVKINGKPRWVFALTKAEAQVFSTAAKPKKSPEDEQAVRFCVYDGKPIVWYTDGEHMVYAVPKFDSEAPDIEFCVPGHELKKAVSKAKVTNLLLVTLDTGTVYLTDKIDLPDALEADSPLPPLTPSGPLTWGREQLEVVYGTDSPPASAEHQTVWAVGGPLLHSLSLVVKAALGGSVGFLSAPVGCGAPLKMIVSDDVDGGYWVVAIMPISGS